MSVVLFCIFNKKSSFSSDTETSRDEFVLVDDSHLASGKYCSVCV